MKLLGYKNIQVKSGTGEHGWRHKALYDAIIITAGLEKVPKELFGQLKNDGVLVAPLGRGHDKRMTRYTKRENKLTKEEFGTFHFVPFVEEKN